MFDAVLREQERELRYGAGLALALLAHAAAFALVTVFMPSAGRSERIQNQFPITLENVLAEAPAPPPPPPPGPAGHDPAPSRAVVRPTPKPVEAKPVEPKPVERAVEPKPVEPTASPAPETPPLPVSPAPEAPGGGGGIEGGVSGGVQGGVVGGHVGGVVGGTGTGTQVLPFGPGMTRPRQISGAAPTYSREALAARVEGKVLVRCVIQASGEVTDCQVLKGVPMLTDVVLASLRTSRFTPVMYRGLPQAIQYLFTFNFKLP
jgi:protein TonB